MPTSLTFAQHLAVLSAAGPRLAALAADAGPTAPVPTCPAWDANALLAHQAMVHRWATAIVTGTDPDDVPTQTELRSHADLAAYYREGLAALVDALSTAPEDLDVMTFLKDPPAPRHFWARRQAHETTVHALDAQAALLGRVPTTEEAGVPTDVAADGLDELLRGFYTRGKSKLFDGTEYTFVVQPTDLDRRWVVRVAERLTVDDGDDAPVPAEPGAVLRGATAALYLALWNRGSDIHVEGDAGVATAWRARQKVTWS